MMRKIKPFLDAHYGPLKGNHHCCTSFTSLLVFLFFQIGMYKDFIFRTGNVIMCVGWSVRVWFMCMLWAGSVHLIVPACRDIYREEHYNNYIKTC